MKAFELCTLNGRVLGFYTYQKITLLYPRARKYIRRLKTQPGGVVIAEHRELQYVIRHRGSNALPATSSLPKIPRPKKSRMASLSNSKVPSASGVKRRRVRFLPTAAFRQR